MRYTSYTFEWIDGPATKPAEFRQVARPVVIEPSDWAPSDEERVIATLKRRSDALLRNIEENNALSSRLKR